jgi:DNA polymerase-3 subunit epsilon
VGTLVTGIYFLQNMKFTCFDFETANMSKESICQVGIVVVDNGNIIETKSWLVNPHSFFDPFNIRIHGITAEMVKGCPKFNELWTEIVPYFNDADFVIAHNARFDIGALDAALELYLCPQPNQFSISFIHKDRVNEPRTINVEDYDFEVPNFAFVCSVAMARRAYSKEPSYSLQSLCSKLGIEYGNHDAGADAKSCAELAIKIFQDKDIDMSIPINEYEDILLLEDKLQIFFGCLCPDGYQNSVCKHLPKPDTKSIVGDVGKNNPDNVFYQKRVLFTGTLSSMNRTEAMQRIADIGGYPEKNMTTVTNILVVGQQDFRVVGESGMSSKQRKAIEMKDKGFDIEIMTEDDFLKNL